jgi:uncharacterized protein YbbC (DUF1343 family)
MFVFIFILILFIPCEAKVKVGLERLFSSPYKEQLKGKRIGIVMNQTAVTADLKTAYECLYTKQEEGGYRLTALFSPEHGLYGMMPSGKDLCDGKTKEGIPIYSLYGAARRPSQKMLDEVDILLYDIQDIGCRSYTFASTLFYVMEEAAKAKKEVIVLDRPNPINGIVVDGPMLGDGMRSFLSYIDVPYCHGMTVGELSHLFNKEYNINCLLQVIWMDGWKRKMSFEETGLPWVPLSPHVPNSQTPLFYPITGFLGELPLVNNGIHSTLPFQLVGAPWLDPDKLKSALDKQNLPGISFYPFHWKPMKGRLADVECHGLLLMVKDSLSYRPVTTGLAILGLLKSLYPEKVKESLTIWPDTTEQFHKVMGSRMPAHILENETYPTWKLIALDQAKRESFLTKRKSYLYNGYE